MGDSVAPSRLAVFARRLALVFILGIAVVVAAIAALIGPYVRDDLALDRTVRAVALDWRDFGEDKAQARLEYELDHMGIGMQVRDGDCHLSEPREGIQRVACIWAVDVAIPGLDLRVPLSFSSRAEIDVDGSLR